MYFEFRSTKRSVTNKLTTDFFSKKPPISKKLSRFQTIKQTETETLTQKPIPVYQPGPKPSELLLRYLNSVTPPKPSRLTIIKNQLHRHTKSYSGFKIESQNSRSKRSLITYSSYGKIMKISI